ncbi:MAG: transcription antitermination factor NusB [Dehalococcoidia bacterium]|nr:transcription antitermination factor NusB [Chloroflexi bacterium CFX7]MCK6564338.1 transcription antitermination factor NusB [Dehalococcoidia bacterium]NUQ55737.1 transcription antitermination factor NusB [Dehalococcoidia bacterium]RIL01544.1 MAG: transcription antitermination factor NusB [bacterium]
MTDSVMRRARFLVVEALYESETSGHDPEAVYNRRLADVAGEDAEVAEPGPAGFGRGVLRGVLRRAVELDRYIGDAATQYPVETMAIVDRNILRLAIWELLSDNSAPVAAVVNEALELAHRYGGESSPGFVHGVLRTVSTRIQAERTAGAPPEPAANTTIRQQEN